ncbi:hypothetical protein [Pasteuria penetrans]|uniref:hypothetical protein n=1 Tax=Pasteuria penetrans TaxID=86005 RepID=UPI000F9099B9|nr:hypothetical protein [Pasteuria penetrans]
MGLPLAVQRRRGLWLVFMSLVGLWSILQVVAQRMHIYEREQGMKLLQQRWVQVQTLRGQLRAHLEAEQTEEKWEGRLHRYGYKRPGESNFVVGPGGVDKST